MVYWGLLPLFKKDFYSLFGINVVSTFVSYLKPNPFLYKYTVLSHIIYFSITTQFNCEKLFYFKLFGLVKQF